MATIRRQRPPSRLLGDRVDVDDWLSRLAKIPDLRWDKVVELRDAIRRDRYDEADRLGAVIRVVRREVQALCDGPADEPDMDSEE